MIPHANLLEVIQSADGSSNISTNSCPQDSALEDVLKHIGTLGDHIAVIDDYGELKGIITKEDAVNALISA